VQNEDLVTFWQFRNDKDSGYSKVKQSHLAKLTNLAVSRNSLDFRDAMAVIAPGWYAAFTAKHQERAWLEGGVYPFLRMPQLLMERSEKLEAQRCSGVVGASAVRGVAVPGEAAGMDAATALRWDAVMCSGPGARNFFSPAEVAAAGGGVEEEGSDHTIKSSRLGAAEIFNCPAERRLHLSHFQQEIRHILSLSAPDLKEWYADAHANLGCPAVEYKNKDQLALAVYDWTVEKWGFSASVSALPAALKREKEKQAKEARKARGEPEPGDDEVDGAAPPAKKQRPGDFMAKADRLAPGAARGPLPAAAPALAAAAPFGAPPWVAPQPEVALVPLHDGVVYGGGGAADPLDVGEGNAMVN
jgi:hypothetical protein